MSGPVRPPLTVETVDGTTVGRPITKIKVTNGDLTVSGTTATIDTSGSGGSPGGSDTEIQYNNAGSFGGDAGLKITTKGGGGTTTIRSGNMLLGGGKVATATANGFVSLISDGVGQIFLTSGAAQGGTFTDTQVNIFANTNTDNAILNFRDSSNVENGRITLKDDGNLEIKNSVSGKNVFLEVTGSAGVTIKQGTTNAGTTFNVEGNGTGTPKINLTNNVKSVTLLCDVNQKLKVDGGTDTFVFDVSSASGGITFPDGTTQTTAASGTSFPRTAPAGTKTAPSYSFSNDTDTGMFLVSAGILGIAVGGDREIRFKQDELQFDGGGGSQYKLTTDGASTNIVIEPTTGGASIEVEAGIGSQNVKISGANGGTVSFNGNYNFPVSDGSANQVLQTNGSGTLSFADASGGGGVGANAVSWPGDDYSGSDRTSNLYSTNNGKYSPSMGDSSYNPSSTDVRYRPYFATNDGDITKMQVRSGSAVAGTDCIVGFYNSGTGGLPTTLIGSATFDMSTTGNKSQTSFSSTITTVRGTLYYIGVVFTGSGSMRGPTQTIGLLPIQANMTNDRNTCVGQTGSSGSLPASFDKTAASLQELVGPPSILISW